MTNGNDKGPIEEPTKQTILWWKEPLNVAGLFIGTHGLAVFLVIYYTIYLYPRAETERGQWITEISSIRQLLDPETRSLSLPQAETVLGIAKFAFIQRLQSASDGAVAAPVLPRATGVQQAARRVESEYVFGELFEYPVEAQPSENSKTQLIALIKNFNSKFEQRQAEHRARLLSIFDNALEQSEPLKHQLGRLRTTGVTLDEVWQNATLNLRMEWSNLTKDLVGDSINYDRRRFESFIRKHPQFDPLAAADPKLVQHLQNQEMRTNSPPATAISAVLEQRFAKELNAIRQRTDKKT
jgi:hypothetical protein